MDQFNISMFDEQIKITMASINEVNKLRQKVSALSMELSLQLPTIWAQQERIVMLEDLLAAEIGKAMPSAPDGGKG